MLRLRLILRRASRLVRCQHLRLRRLNQRACRLPLVREGFLALNGVVLALGEATRQGTAFVFGYLGGGPAPFETAQPANGFVLAFQALPLVLVISALSATPSSRARTSLPA